MQKGKMQPGENENLHEIKETHHEKMKYQRKRRNPRENDNKNVVQMSLNLSPEPKMYLTSDKHANPCEFESFSYMISSVAVSVCSRVGGFICDVCFVIIFSSIFHAYIVLTPLNPTFMQYSWGLQGIHYFSYFY